MPRHVIVIVIPSFFGLNPLLPRQMPCQIWVSLQPTPARRPAARSADARSPRVGGSTTRRPGPRRERASRAAMLLPAFSALPASRRRRPGTPARRAGAPQPSAGVGGAAAPRAAATAGGPPGRVAQALRCRAAPVRAADDDAAAPAAAEEDGGAARGAAGAPGNDAERLAADFRRLNRLRDVEGASRAGSRRGCTSVRRLTRRRLRRACAQTS
jgi:hypothetical protein